MNNLKLYKILFEGLLKIPPVLSNKVKKSIKPIVAGKYFLIAKKLSEDSPRRIEQLDNNVKHLEKVREPIEMRISLEVSSLMKIKIADGDYETETTRVIPLIKNLRFTAYDFGNGGKEVLIDKITLRHYMSSNSDEIAIDVAFYAGNSENPFYVDEGSHPENLIRSFTYTLDSVTDYDTARSTIEDESTQFAELAEYLKPFFKMAPKELLAKVGNSPERAENLGIYEAAFMLTEKDFEGWDPGGRKFDLSTALKSKSGSASSLYVKFPFANEKISFDRGGSYAGSSMQGSFFEMEVIVPYIPNENLSIEKINEIIVELYRVIDHELGHFIQDLMQISATGVPMFIKRERFGYPSKKISQKIPELKPGGGWSEKHELRDIEFYTRLGDSKVRIEEIYKRNLTIPKEERDAIFKTFIGMSAKNLNGRYFYQYSYLADPWFKTLKIENPGKWAKAVKELYKSMQRYLKP